MVHHLNREKNRDKFRFSSVLKVPTKSTLHFFAKRHVADLSGTPSTDFGVSDGRSDGTGRVFQFFRNARLRPGAEDIAAQRRGRLPTNHGEASICPLFPLLMEFIKRCKIIITTASTDQYVMPPRRLFVAPRQPFAAQALRCLHRHGLPS